MFDRMMVTPIVQVGADADLQAATTALLPAAGRNFRCDKTLQSRSRSPMRRLYRES